MKEIEKILEKSNLLFECENTWREFSKGRLFSAIERKSVYGEIIHKEIGQIKKSGRYNFHYKSAEEELADLQKALQLLDENAKELSNSSKD